jgi:hypothetical protein
LRHHCLLDRLWALSTRRFEGISSTSKHLACRPWHSSTDRLLRERCQTHHCRTLHAPAPNDARTSYLPSNILYSMQHSTSQSAVEGRTACAACSLNWHPAPGSCATTIANSLACTGRKILSANSALAHSAAKGGESERELRLRLHDSCDVDLSTAESLPGTVLRSLRGKLRGRKVRPAIAVTSCCPRSWWRRQLACRQLENRPVAAFSTLPTRVPTHVSTFGVVSISSLSNLT